MHRTARKPHLANKEFSLQNLFTILPTHHTREEGEIPMKLSALYILLLGVIFGLSGCHGDSHHHSDDNGNDCQSGNCGDNGGGDNGDNNGNGSGDDNGNKGSAGVTVKFKGQVLDGYLYNASLCLDLDQDQACSGFEPSGTTDRNGRFAVKSTISSSVLENTPYKCLNDQSCAEGMPIRVIARSTADTTMVTYGRNAALPQSMALTATSFISSDNWSGDVLTLPFSRLTPFTTLTDLTIGDITSVQEDTYTRQLNTVAEKFGVVPAAAKIDYNDQDGASDQTMKALVASELIGRNGMLPQDVSALQQLTQKGLSMEELTGMAESIASEITSIAESADPDNPGELGNILASYKPTENKQDQEENGGSQSGNSNSSENGSSGSSGNSSGSGSGSNSGSGSGGQSGGNSGSGSGGSSGSGSGDPSGGNSGSGSGGNSGSSSSGNSGSGSGSQSGDNSGSGSGDDSGSGSGGQSGGDSGDSGSGDDSGSGSGGQSGNDSGDSGSGDDCGSDNSGQSGDDSGTGDETCDQDTEECGSQGEGDLDIVISGQVIDGYLKNARVCLDLDQDNVCTPADPATTTDNQGKFTFNGISKALAENTPYRCLVSKSCGAETPLRVLAFTTDETMNITLGKEAPLTVNLALSATVFINSPDQQNNSLFARITPYTTIADMVTGGASGASRDNYHSVFEQIAETLGVDPDAARSDYNDASDVTDESKKALVAAEVFGRSGMLPADQDELQQRTDAETTMEDVEDMAETVKEDIETITDNTSTDNTSDISDTLDNYTDNATSSISQLAGHNSDDFKCGISKTHNVYCWGNNSWGNLGDPSVFPTSANGEPVADGTTVADNFQAKPVVVKTDKDTPLGNVRQIDAGNAHACATTFDGSVYCWGSNAYGQAGTGSITSDNSRVFYASKVVKGKQSTEGEYLSNAVSVTLSHNASCALLRNGEVYCWGENTVKQLGDAHPDDEVAVGSGRQSPEGIDLTGILKAVPYPVKVDFPETVERVTDLTAGMWIYCALVENNDGDDHNVYCWGNDTRGLVSQHWKQYQEDFKANYAQKLKLKDQSALADATGEKPEMWFVYDNSGDKHPLYGAAVRHEIKYNKTEHNNHHVSLSSYYIGNNASILVSGNICSVFSWYKSNINIAKRIISETSSAEYKYSDISRNNEYFYGHNIESTKFFEDDGKDDCGPGLDKITNCKIHNTIYIQYFPVSDKNNQRNVRITCDNDGIASFTGYNWNSQNTEPDYKLELENSATPVEVSSIDLSVEFPIAYSESIFLRNIEKLAIWKNDSEIIINSDDNNFFKLSSNGEPENSELNGINLHLENDWISRIDASVDNSIAFALTVKGTINGFDWDQSKNYNTDYYGLGGNGNDVLYYLFTPVLTDGTAVTNVKDVSLGKHSACATVNVHDDQDRPTTQNELYCWGSSTFGQLGFDNQDGGFSYKQMMDAFDGHTPANVYLQVPARLELNPKKTETLDFMDLSSGGD